MTNYEAAELRRLLGFTLEALREHAAEQSYRRDAMKAIRERLLSEFHERRAQESLQLRAALEVIVQALEPPEEQPWRLQVPHVAKPGPGAPVVDDQVVDVEVRALPPLEVDDASRRARPRRRVPQTGVARAAVEGLDRQRGRG